jgi:hypothetical protein
MKKLLLAAVAAIALNSAAQVVTIAPTIAAESVKLPARYNGHWCPVKKDNNIYEKGSHLYKRVRPTDCTDEADAGVGVTARGYGGPETDCRIAKVAVAPEKKGYLITLRCRQFDTRERYTDAGQVRLQLLGENRLVIQNDYD